MAANDPFSQLPGLPSLDMLKPRGGLSGLRGPAPIKQQTLQERLAIGGGYSSGVNSPGYGTFGTGGGGGASAPPDARFPNAGWGSSLSRGDLLGGGMGTDLTGMTDIGSQASMQAYANAAKNQANQPPAGTQPGVASGTPPTLSPEEAARRQMETERTAYGQNISSFTDPALAMLGNRDPYDSPSFPAEYWDRMKRERQGENAANFAQLRKETERQARMGLISALDARTTLRQLQQDGDAADQRAYAEIDNKRIAQAEQGRLDRANLYLRGAQIAPYAGENWTRVQEYLQGNADAATARNALTPLLQGAGLGMAGGMYGGIGGGGGGGGGATGVPANQGWGGDNWGVGPGGVSQPGQGNYFGRRGGGGAAPAAPDLTGTEWVGGGNLPPALQREIWAFNSAPQEGEVGSDWPLG